MADADADARAAAKALEKKLGRKLRTQIDGDENGALTEAEEEELILARLTSGDQWIPAEEFLEEFKHLRRKPAGEGRGLGFFVLGDSFTRSGAAVRGG